MLLSIPPGCISSPTASAALLLLCLAPAAFCCIAPDIYLACCMPCCIYPLLVVHIGQLQHLHCLCVLQHKKLSYFLLHTTRARCYTTAGAGERAEHKPDTFVKSIYRRPRSELGRVRCWLELSQVLIQAESGA